MDDEALEEEPTDFAGLLEGEGQGEEEQEEEEHEIEPSQKRHGPTGKKKTAAEVGILWVFLIYLPSLGQQDSTTRRS